MKLSLVVPVYNEEFWIKKFWTNLKRAPISGCNGINEVQIVVVNDGSTDRTADILAKLCAEEFVFTCGVKAEVRLMNRSENHGKGYSVRQGIAQTTGDVVIIQDADMEYSPSDYPALINPITEGSADAVFGSRFVGHPRRVLYFWHSLLNNLLTLLSNLLSDLNLTDMETCYKAVRGDILRSVRLVSNRFGFEPEITSRLARAKIRIFEVPVQYHGRTYEEGKKIGWKDGVAAIFHIIKFNLFDTEPFLPGLMQTLTALDHLNGVIYAPILEEALMGLLPVDHRPRILEVGAGIGSLTKVLLKKGDVLATDISPAYVEKLSWRFKDYDNLNSLVWDASKPIPTDFGKFDLIVSFNVLEHIEQDQNALDLWAGLLKPEGHLIVLVPAFDSLYCGIDRSAGHYRRYRKTELARKAQSAGLAAKNIFFGNALGILGWYVNGKLLGAKTLSNQQLFLFVLLKRMFGFIERRLHRYVGLSIILVGQKAMVSQKVPVAAD